MSWGVISKGKYWSGPRHIRTDIQTVYLWYQTSQTPSLANTLLQTPPKGTNLSNLLHIVLRSPMMGEIEFLFPKKMQGKKVSVIILSTPTNASPVSQVKRCISIYSDWIACTTAEKLSWGYLPVFFLIVLIFLRQRSLSQTITFGLVVPDVTPKITCAHEHLKYVRRPELFSGL